MLVKPLLPGKWDRGFSLGTNRIGGNEFEGRLFVQAKLTQSGIPSMLARPFAFTKALDLRPPTPDAMKEFTLLVQGMFLGLIKFDSYPLVQQIALTDTIKNFEPGMAEFHVLKWKGKAIGGTYPDCVVFPGAKFVCASDWRDNADGDSPEGEYVESKDNQFPRDVTLQALQREIKAEVELYSPNLVRALYCRWVEEIKGILQVPKGQNNPVWFDRLNDIQNSFWPTNLKAPEEALDDFTQKVIHLTCRSHDGGMKSIPIRSMKESIFCERTVRFTFNTGRVFPDIPLKSKYLHMVDVDRSTMDIGADGQQQYRIRLRNWPGDLQWSPRDRNIEDVDKASILLWPDFKANGWNVNYVYFAPSPTLEGLNPSLRLIGDDFSVMREIRGVDGCVVERPVGFVEVEVDNSPVGIFRDNRPTIGRGGAQVGISVDFGTSNSSIGEFDPDNNKYLTFQFEDLTHDLLPGSYWGSSEQHCRIRRENAYFLPTASLEGSCSSLPSEIIFRDGQMKLRGDEALEHPIRNFTIPYPSFERSNAHKMIVGGFKWEAPWGGAFTTANLVSNYLKIVFHMVLAQLRKEHLTTNVSVVPTYPLAFGKNKFDEYKKLLGGAGDGEGLLDEISDETGVRLSLAMVNANQALHELVAESFAVKAFWSGQRGTSELVVDIGGGSTDLAMWVNGNILVDSIRYGGNDYVRYLARKFSTFLPDIVDLSERTIALQRIMRRAGIMGILNSYPPASKSAAQQAIDRFFLGIFLYVFRLIENFNVNHLKLYPVGNGWRFIEGYFPPNDNMQSYIRRMFAEFGGEIDIDVIPPRDNDYKGAVCRGARKIAADCTYFHPTDIQVKTILGGSLVVNSTNVAFSEPVPTGALGEPPIGFDTSDFVDEIISRTGRNIPENTQSLIVGALNKEMESAAYPVPPGKCGINKSVFSVFLEKIYPDHFM